MTPENFCYWLQGYFELTHSKNLNSMQFQIVQDHLNLVFNKVTPERFDVDENFYFDKFGIARNTPKKEDTYCFCRQPICECKGYQKIFAPHSGITAPVFVKYLSA